jgi:hypothetical protein
MLRGPLTLALTNRMVAAIFLWCFVAFRDLERNHPISAMMTQPHQQNMGW